MVANGSIQLGGQFRYNEDLQSGDTVGIGYLQSTIGNGERSSGATAYVDPILERENLNVLIQTQVTRIVQTGEEDGKPVFREIQAAQGPTGEIRSLLCRSSAFQFLILVNRPNVLIYSL